MLTIKPSFEKLKMDFMTGNGLQTHTWHHWHSF